MQPEAFSINEGFLERFSLRKALIANYIKPWTCIILKKYDIAWSEFESKFEGCDLPLQNYVLNRKTNPVDFVKNMRMQEARGRCAAGFYTSSEIYYDHACQIQVIHDIAHQMKVRKTNPATHGSTAAARLHAAPYSEHGTARAASPCCPAVAAKGVEVPHCAQADGG